MTLSAISIVIFFSLSNTIIAGIHFNNEGNTILTDEEAQITGWIANNVNYNTNILVDRMSLLKFLDDIAKINVYSIDNEVKTAIFSDYRYDITSETDANCSIATF